MDQVDNGFQNPTADVSHVARKWLDIPYAPASATQQLDVYLPETGDGPFPIILRIHGGGFEFGDKCDFQLLAFLRGVERGYAVVSANYRMSGEALFPAAVQDVKAAVRWLKASGARYQLGREPHRRVWRIGGRAPRSHGCDVAEDVVLFDDARLGNAEQSCAVQVAVDWFGPIDFSDDGRAARRERSADARPSSRRRPRSRRHGPDGSSEAKYLGAPIADVPDLVRAANPATYLHPGMPPILIQHGSADPLVPVQQSVEFARVIAERAGRRAVRARHPRGRRSRHSRVRDRREHGPRLGFIDRVPRPAARLLLTER